jgi:hypothetical protein
MCLKIDRRGNSKLVIATIIRKDPQCMLLPSSPIPIASAPAVSQEMHTDMTVDREKLKSAHDWVENVPLESSTSLVRPECSQTQRPSAARHGEEPSEAQCSQSAASMQLLTSAIGAEKWQREFLLDGAVMSREILIQPFLLANVISCLSRENCSWKCPWMKIPRYLRSVCFWGVLE